MKSELLLAVPSAGQDCPYAGIWIDVSDKTLKPGKSYVYQVEGEAFMADYRPDNPFPGEIVGRVAMVGYDLE